MAALTARQKEKLNKMNPAAAATKLGDRVAAAETSVTANTAALATLKTQFNALLAKLDADGGVTDTNYSSTLGIP